MAYEYIERFKKMSFGMFCRFGLYSRQGTGERASHSYKVDRNEYNKLTQEFDIAKDWAKQLVETAKFATLQSLPKSSRFIRKGLGIRQTNDGYAKLECHRFGKQNVKREIREKVIIKCYIHWITEDIESEWKTHVFGKK